MGDRHAFEPLRTARLLLRRQRVSDAGVWRELWTERDPRVPAHRRIDVEGRPTEHDIADTIREGAGDPPGLWAIELRSGGDVVGYCGLVQDDATGRPELAFELLRRVHGHGLATEAGGAVVAWAASSHDQLWATVWDWNRPSRRVLEKLGFEETSRSGADRAGAGTLVMTRRLSPPLQRIADRFPGGR